MIGLIFLGAAIGWWAAGKFFDWYVKLLGFNQEEND